MSEILDHWESDIDRCVTDLEPTLIAVRRHFHAHPEPSGEEVQTTDFLARRLSSVGLNPRVFRDRIGVSVDLTLGRASAELPLIAIRSDLDALRLPDEKEVPYRSQNPDVHHACGHDAHAAMVLGTALASVALGQSSASTESATSGRVGGARLRLLFQPAEETSQGANWLVEQGVLDGVDVILGLHVDPERLAGQVGIRYGVLTANCDEVAFLVDGHGGHAARPHHTVDSVATASQLITALYQFLPRAVDIRDPSVFTVGQINGGYAANVIPERVELRGSLRTINLQTRKTLQQRIIEIADGVERISGARIQCQFLNPLNSVNNHPQITAALEEASERVVGKENVKILNRPSMGGEDFSVYLNYVPGAMLRLGCAEPDVEPPLFLHSPLFNLDERSLGVGTRILLRAALLLSDDRLTALAQKD